MHDYIVVGAGAAGCVVAARLSEQADAKVLLLEAGPRDIHPYIHLPAGSFKLAGGPLTWGYRTVPQRHCKGREIAFVQGRVLGGGSSINGEVFTRGCPEDYDRWARDEGCAGWSFDEVRPYFVKSEDNDLLCDDYHGVGGPLGVASIAPHPMTRRFVQACQQAGIPRATDFNGARQEGCGVYQATTRNARRCSSAVAYLRPARRRANLEVRTHAPARRIVVESGRAVGVDYAFRGRPRSARASREVILAAGAIGSPRLLMLSGLGPAAHLMEHGIEVVADLPGVGRNLQDHVDIDIVYELFERNSFDKYARPHWMLWAGLQYLLFRSGPAASTLVEGGAFTFADRSAPTPDLQFHFLPGAGLEPGVPAVPSGAGVTLNGYFLRPRSRGSVTLRGADPAIPPAIDPNYLAHPRDLEVAVESVRTMRHIMTRPVFAGHIKREHHPGAAVKTDAEIEDYARGFGRTAYHPAGTCRMGIDEEAVVDPRLRLRGIDRLRVCDSSIMPSLVSSNTNAASVMIGEKASELIKADA